MPNPLAAVEPVAVWEHFYRLSQIPHPSGGERAICLHILGLAQGLGLAATMDRAGGADFGNLIVRLPASPGCEGAPIIVIQSHLDMVALPVERRGLPLDLLLDGTVLRARGSTLGADNGIAVAIALTLMTEPGIVHGPLELLFTVNEEAGMTGVLGLGAEALEGRTLINLDTLSAGVLTVCSAGACHCDLRLPLVREPMPVGLVGARLRIHGGRGGHSGLDIDGGRANAGQLLARLISDRCRLGDLRLLDLSWGEVLNAIPAEAEAWLGIPAAQVGDWQLDLPRWEEAFNAEFGGCDGPFRLDLRLAEPAQRAALSQRDTRRVLALLIGLPHGVYSMSGTLPGLVETSANVALVRLAGAELRVSVSQRGLTDGSLEAAIRRCEAVAELAGASSARIGRTRGWTPNLASPLLEVCRETYRATYGADPEVTGLHGMLECGILKERFPDLDLISFGPTIQDAHTPTAADYRPGLDASARGERIDTATLPQFWAFVQEVLRRLATPETGLTHPGTDRPETGPLRAP